MDVPEKEVLDNDAPIARFKTGLDLSKVMNGGATFDVDEEFIDKEAEEMKPIYTVEEAQGYTKLENLGFIEDENEDDEGSPFEILGKRMINLTNDGKIKKKILREGYDSILPELCTVTIHYNAYLEFNETPFDSTYLRKRPYSFRLDSDEELPGLALAVKSMKLSEKSEFLVHYDYAYGALGCKPRIPEKATILFEIEILKYIDSGAYHLYGQLTEEEKHEFQNIYKCVQAMCLIGNDYYSKNMIKQAVKEYNLAALKLENCTLKDYEEQEKQQKLLLRLYTNLVVANTKLEKPRQACASYNRIINMCRGTSLHVPAKVYYNNAKCMTMFGDYDRADVQFRKALNVEPHNAAIQKGYAEFKKEKSKCTFPFLKPKPKEETVRKQALDEDFKQSVKGLCEDLNASEQVLMYQLPDDLTEAELDFVKSNVGDYNLKLDSNEENGLIKYFVAKLSLDEN